MLQYSGVTLDLVEIHHASRRCLAQKICLNNTVQEICRTLLLAWVLHCALIFKLDLYNCDIADTLRFRASFVFWFVLLSSCLNQHRCYLYLSSSIRYFVVDAQYAFWNTNQRIGFNRYLHVAMHFT